MVKESQKAEEKETIKREEYLLLANRITKNSIRLILESQERVVKECQGAKENEIVNSEEYLSLANRNTGNSKELTP